MVEKKCPLRWGADKGMETWHCACIEKECAWWTNDQCCAIRSIAMTLDAEWRAKP